MVAQPTWANPKFSRAQRSPAKPALQGYELAKAIYKETNGATPELRKLVSDYKAMKASGAIRTSDDDATGSKR